MGLTLKNVLESLQVWESVITNITCVGSYHYKDTVNIYLDWLKSHKHADLWANCLWRKLGTLRNIYSCPCQSKTHSSREDVHTYFENGFPKLIDIDKFVFEYDIKENKIFEAL